MTSGISPLDWWSIVHFLSGVGLAVLGLNTRWSIGILIGFEFIEGMLRLIPRAEGPLFEVESYPNIVADVFIGLLGFIVAEALLRRLESRRLLHFVPKLRRSS